MATSKNVLILTGSSRGIGRALLEKYLKANYYVFHVSRSESSIDQPNQKHFKISVSDYAAMDNMLLEILENPITKQASRILLINNAGRLGESAQLQHIDSQNITDTISINLSAAMVACSKFLNKFQDSGKELKIINISSGAARGGIEGWSVYSASKAGMDAFTKTIGLELNASQLNAQAISVYPGIVDTKMQEEIRSSNEEYFPNVERFRNFKSNNELSTPSAVANKIFYLDHFIQTENGAIVDIRNIELK